MKRLLADGYPDIYSICRVFRDGEFGQNHLPEFTMLEWYRLNFNLRDIIADTPANGPIGPGQGFPLRHPVPPNETASAGKGSRSGGR